MVVSSNIYFMIVLTSASRHDTSLIRFGGSATANSPSSRLSQRLTRSTLRPPEDGSVSYERRYECVHVFYFFSNRVPRTRPPTPHLPPHRNGPSRLRRRNSFSHCCSCLVFLNHDRFSLFCRRETRQQEAIRAATENLPAPSERPELPATMMSEARKLRVCPAQIASCAK